MWRSSLETPGAVGPEDGAVGPDRRSSVRPPGWTGRLGGQGGGTLDFVRCRPTPVPPYLPDGAVCPTSLKQSAARPARSVGFYPGCLKDHGAGIRRVNLIAAQADAVAGSRMMSSIAIRKRSISSGVL